MSPGHAMHYGQLKKRVLKGLCYPQGANLGNDMRKTTKDLLTGLDTFIDFFFESEVQGN